MIDQLKRHAIQVLRTAGHTLDEIAALVAVGKRSVQRVAGEPMITHLETQLDAAATPIAIASVAVIDGCTAPPHASLEVAVSLTPSQHFRKYLAIPLA